MVLSGAVLRLWDLGSRALHHDESLHGDHAYQIFQGHGYEHLPWLHGPFQFFGTALTFFLGGAATDYSLRILPVLFGTAFIALPLLLKSHLGRPGSLIAAGLIAFSPVLLYYSRFAREDIYVAVFTLGMVVCLWRYVEGGRAGYLYGMAGLLALSFATKENTFITAAILLLFLNLWTATILARQTTEGRGGGGVAEGARVLFYVPFAWLLVALWPAIAGLRRRLGLQERHAAIDVLLVLGTLAGPQFAAVVELPLEAAGLDFTTTTDERWLGFASCRRAAGGKRALWGPVGGGGNG